MGKSLAFLKQDCRYSLGDLAGAATFSDFQLEFWINQAIRELSTHFPRQIVYTLATTPGVQQYDLEVVHLALLSVEYPTGEKPKRFLQRRSYTHPQFWLQGGCYDFIKAGDADSDNPPYLVISELPAAAEVITLQVLCEHNELMESNDETTLPERLEPLIISYVRWKAVQELALGEAMNPSEYSTLTYSMEMNAGRAERTYRSALKEMVALERESGVVNWRMDKFDGWY